MARRFNGRLRKHPRNVPHSKKRALHEWRRWITSYPGWVAVSGQKYAFFRAKWNCYTVQRVQPFIYFKQFQGGREELRLITEASAHNELEATLEAFDPCETDEVYIENGPNRGEIVKVEPQWQSVTLIANPKPWHESGLDDAIETATYRISRNCLAIGRGAPESPHVWPKRPSRVLNIAIGTLI